jgi:uncharacterized protein (TIGR02118 family)
MVKLVYCIRRKPDMSLEAFQERWLQVHGPLVKRLAEVLPMRRYVQSHTIPGEGSDALRASRGAKPAYDGITEVWLDSKDALAPSSEAALDATRQLFEDEMAFIDFADSALFLTEEHEIF